MTALSPLQRQKLLHLFRLLDTNHNDLFEQGDVIILIDRIAEARHYAPDSQAYRILHHAYLRAFERVAGNIGREDDGVITREQWLAFFERATQSTTFYDEFIAPLLSSMIALLDVNGDDKIQIDDLRILARGVGTPFTVVTGIFEKLDTNRDGVLSLEEAGVAMRTFFLSDDASLPGNWAFGDYTKEML
jgi:Ca2+-binding EF-hand superfamily protein